MSIVRMRAVLAYDGWREESGIMKQIGVAIVGTGWCGGIRAEACAAHPLVKSLDLVETRPERLDEMVKKTHARSGGSDYRKLLDKQDIDAVYISATPEDTH